MPELALSSFLFLLLLLFFLFFDPLSATHLPFSRDRRLGRSIHGHVSLLEENMVSEGSAELCNIFNGRWVFDESYPLYSSQSCPYISSRVNCKYNGRPDSDYQKWRWQPDTCNVPRFDGEKLLEGLRGKRLMIVGDSLDRSMWESLVCMLLSYSPDITKSIQLNYPFNVFRALEYNASVEFFWAPFLVDLDMELVLGQPKRVLKPYEIEGNAQAWRGVDILIFNSAHYWTHLGGLKSWDYIEYENGLYEDLDRMFIYQKGMETWASWIDSNLDPQKTRVFFRSISPIHTDPSQWDEPNGNRCVNETEPITQDAFLSPIPPQMTIIETVLKQMKFPVYFFNITRLSDYRKDAHPSVYTSGDGEMRYGSASPADCSHWCVSGVPDIWNELLAFLLLY
ncbi:hypothetical protein AMTRI_Chr08g161920 [Amborella trichopoda]|uniref:Uncharacterized protein n=1 Tax=Amborella trichopoda TaxID=13333 RepID=W1PIY7_AMBTC|nr:protein trichome birefringence-like 36 [Amborella trichopoda]ERN07968.1 hypothetical protein AMTR_s00012p00251740 [Amborella trichopoda]|eukprot:XP_006846293.1 protein trichome birefringence-like 36 [Amborella trichopoda]